MQHVERRIVIAPQHQPTMAAGMGTVAQPFLDEFAAGRAYLGSVGVPLARARTSQRDRFERSFHGVIQDDMHRADFGEDQPVSIKPHPIVILRIGETVVAPCALKPRGAGSPRRPSRGGGCNQILAWVASTLFVAAT